MGSTDPMKSLTKILTVALLLLSLVASARHTDEHRTGTHRYKNIFVFKTDKKFLGAKVEIISAEGNLITSQQVERRKVVIDFDAVKYGTYTIRVSKGKESKTFLFVKK